MLRVFFLTTQLPPPLSCFRHRFPVDSQGSSTTSEEQCARGLALARGLAPVFLMPRFRPAARQALDSLVKMFGHAYNTRLHPGDLCSNYRPNLIAQLPTFSFFTLGSYNGGGKNGEGVCE